MNQNLPDATGHFGEFGGRYAPETLMSPLLELEDAYMSLKEDSDFQEEFQYYLREYVGRPNPLYYAEGLTQALGGAKIYLKREDLNHTGAHKINNAIGQILLARRMGKDRIIAETGAGQHGVATATVAAKFDMECEVYMGEEDIVRQALNVFRMKLLGTTVTPVDSGSCTLKDAINAAFRDWVTNVRTTYYLIGSVVGPHPYPMIVRDFQAVIGQEARAQTLEQTGRLPDYVVACVGGGSNSIGIFYPFYADSTVKLVGVEAAGESILSGRHAATISAGSIGVFHGAKCYLLQEDDGQITPAHSISAGLDYPLDPNIASTRQQVAPNMSQLLMRNRSKGSSCYQKRKGSSLHWKQPTQWLTSANLHRHLTETKPSSSASPGVGIKMCTPSPKCSA